MMYSLQSAVVVTGNCGSRTTRGNKLSFVELDADELENNDLLLCYCIDSRKFTIYCYCLFVYGSE